MVIRLQRPTNPNLSQTRMNWKLFEGKSNPWKPRLLQKAKTSLQKTPRVGAHAVAAEADAAEEKQDALSPKSPPPTPTQEAEPAEGATVPKVAYQRRSAAARMGNL